MTILHHSSQTLKAQRNIENGTEDGQKRYLQALRREEQNIHLQAYSIEDPDSRYDRRPARTLGEQ